MKLKIEIDENDYNQIVEQVKNNDYPDMRVGRAIANGVPTKDWVRPAGEWVKETATTFRCSGCNRRIRAKYNEIDEHTIKIVKPRFCDNCGAYMNGNKDD